MRTIEFHDVWEKYRIKFIKEGKVRWEEVWALEEASFRVDKGEVLGVIGQNGAGKTTLLKLIAGMLMPDKGKIDVEGRVSMLMELGAGFNPEFTGRENIVLNARIYGLEEEVLNRQMEKIIEFAGLGSFIDAPIRYYSQGMYMRLAFALAIHVDPDILLIDDILAVGDEEAQQKCINKIFELKESGKTIILVSHDLNMISRLCDKVILLQKSRIIKEGSPQQVIQHYLETIGDKKGIAVLEKDDLRVAFNNGRLNFSYRNNLLTKGMGASVSFLLPEVNLWTSSSNLFWQVKDFGVDGIVAEGRSQEQAVSLVWKIQILQGKLQFAVEVKDRAIKEPHLNLFLASDYKEWVSLEKEGEFPVFSHKLNWKEVDFAGRRDNALGLIPNLENSSLPFLVFQSGDGQDYSFKLFNTGYEQEARVIQLPLPENDNAPVKISFFTQRTMFEGYIKQEKQNLLVKHQEEQASLRACRSIESGNLRLFADVETKSLRIYFKDKELTRSPGLHISFLADNNWHDTSSCDWQVKKESQVLILNFTWKELGFGSSFKLYFNNNCLIWQVDCENSGDFGLEPIKYGLLLIPDYRSYFCGHQEGKFPLEFTRWQDISLEDPYSELFGARKENGLPALTLKNKDSFTCIVQNSDPAFSCRGLQLCLHKDMAKEKRFSFNTELAFLENEALIVNYLKEKKELLLLKKKQEEERAYAQRNISSGRLRLFADPEHKVIRLYYNDKEITGSKGLYSSFYARQHRVDLNYAAWRIDKVSEKELKLFLTFESLSLSQVWALTCEEESILLINIGIEVNSPMPLTNQEVRLELQDKYENWSTRNEQGNFSVSQYINDIGPIRLKDNKVSGIFLKSDNKITPALFFGIASQADKRIMAICKYRENNEECLRLNTSLIIPKREELVNPGRYDYFKGKIALGKDINFEDESVLISPDQLTRGSLRFIFDRGRGKIFWGKDELTSGLGVYASLRYSGIWYDSYQAAWQLVERSEKKIIVRGDWPYIPISQVWEIELTREDVILWKADMEVHEEIILEIEQANVMLTCGYKNWVIPDSNKGIFLDEYTQGYDILPFRFWYGITDEIASTGKGLPKLIFKNSLKEKAIRGIVENTDYFYQARILQYQKTSLDKLSPGKYPYFKGVITIEPEK